MQDLQRKVSLPFRPLWIQESADSSIDDDTTLNLFKNKTGSGSATSSTSTWAATSSTSSWSATSDGSK